MKNLKLFTKTLVMVTVITAIPYAFAAYSGPEAKQQKPGKNTKSKQLPIKSSHPKPSSKEGARTKSTKLKTKPKPDDQFTLLGKWHASYPSMKMDAVYEIQKAHNHLQGYLVAYIDQQGNRYPERLPVLTIQSFNNQQGKALYQMKYEGKQYKVRCTLTLKNAQTLELNYAYEGYPLKETWKRINK
ncbi:MAG TPA: hypothetical protein DCS93_39320 [Microscillaceae bacterium]|nr:hypothetical protein [Microscillaceae bacterium]